MKLPLLLALLPLSACSLRPTVGVVPSATTVVVKGGPGSTPRAGVMSIMVYVPDSSEATFARLLTGLTKAGYQLPPLTHRERGKSVAFSTEPKTIANVSGLSLQVVTSPVPQGSEVTFMGKYVPVDSLGQAERDSGKWKWINYGIPVANLPAQIFWDDMQRVAQETFPEGRFTYW